MAFDIEMIKKVYAQMAERVDKARDIVGKPLTLSEKILYTHLWDGKPIQSIYTRKRLCRFCSRSYCLSGCNSSNGLLQFMQAGKTKVAVPTTVHCDHLIQAKMVQLPI